MKKHFKFILLLFVISLFGLIQFLIFDENDWHKNFLLSHYFQQRGPIPPPNDIVVIAVNERSANQLGLANNPARWQRDIHGQLLQQLKLVEARVVAFDIFFREAKNPQADLIFSQAIRDFENAILFANLDNNHLELASTTMRATIETLQAPLPQFANAAVGIAPFVLPKTKGELYDFWPFRPSAGDSATLPILAIIASYSQINQRLSTILQQNFMQTATDENQRLVAFSLMRMIDTLRNLSQIQTQQLIQILNASLSDQSERLQAMRVINLAQQRAPLLLNFYGPPYTITTYDYADVVLNKIPHQSLKNKIVFVGFSEQKQLLQTDNFVTPYSQSNGLDLSGVEIAATAAANSLYEQDIKTLSPANTLVIILIYALVVSCLSYFLAVRWAVIVAIISVIAIYQIGLYAFVELNTWLPWSTSLIAQTLLALAIGLYLQAQLNRQKREHLTQVFSHYIPEQMVKTLSRENVDVANSSQHCWAVVMFTDAASYTSLAEQLTPQALNDYLNRYYEKLFACVKAEHGVITDVEGDAMVAVWTAEKENAACKVAAIRAALAINQAIANASENQLLQTRIGIHAGEIVMANIGAHHHYEYRAVGDVVNTASRIQGMNKKFKSQILLSEAVCIEHQDWAYRPLGNYLLAGKSISQFLYEIIPPLHTLNVEDLHLLSLQNQAVEKMRLAQWQQANEIFQAMNEQYPQDSISEYLKHKTQSLATSSSVSNAICENKD